jgi:hypothetical protein
MEAIAGRLCRAERASRALAKQIERMLMVSAIRARKGAQRRAERIEKIAARSERKKEKDAANCQENNAWKP